MLGTALCAIISRGVAAGLVKFWYSQCVFKHNVLCAALWQATSASLRLSTTTAAARLWWS